MINNQITFSSGTDYRFDFSKAKDAYIWLKDDRQLIDFTSAWNVTNLGWNNQEINDAMKKQIDINTVNLLWGSDDIQIEYASKLTESLPASLNIVSRATGGTEANEEALKTARAFTGRKKYLGFKDTYHGQSFGSMAIGYRPEYVTSIEPLVPGYTQMEFPRQDLKDFAIKLEELLSTKEYAAIITEAGIITGWGSTYIAPKGYLTLVRELTKKYGTLMILDEVGTGFSRCGKLYGMEIEGVVPDLVTFAKGVTNGAAALGIMVTTKEIANATVESTNLTSTFGWNPVACAAAIKTLEIHQRDKVWEKSEQDGKYIVGTLKEKIPTAKVSGLGMEISLEMPDIASAQSLVKNAFENGLHISIGSDSNIQIMPPLTIDRKVLDEGLGVLVDCANKT